MSEIGFYLSHPKREKSALDIIIRYQGQRYKIPSGVSVLITYWNKNKQRCKEVDAYPVCWDLNKRLKSIDIKCQAVMQDITNSLTIPTQNELSRLISAKIKPSKVTGDKNNVTDYIESFIEQVNRAPLTIKRYNTTLHKLQEYEKEFNFRLSWSDLDMKFYNNFQHWMYRSKLRNNTEQGYSINYFGDMIKNIKMFYRSAREDGIHKFTLPDKFVTISEDSDSIYLNDTELLSLFDLVIDEKLILSNHDYVILNVTGNIQRMIESLIDCRDRFLIGAYTAMRYSDYAHLRGVKHKDTFISRISQKTGAKTVIPTHQVIKDILLRRSDKLPPVISNQKMNDQLKVLCRMAGINQKIETTITKGGRKVRESHFKYDLVTTHTARRSGCTNMMLAGIDVHDIMSFSGHKTERSFQKYVKATAREVAEKLKDHTFFTGV